MSYNARDVTYVDYYEVAHPSGEYHRFHDLSGAKDYVHHCEGNGKPVVCYKVSEVSERSLVFGEGNWI